jgi:NAD(P)H-dependent FMN reductase
VKQNRENHMIDIKAAFVEREGRHAVGTSENQSVEIRVIGLAGSLRPESATRAAVRFALHGAEEEGAKVSLMDLSAYDLPFLGLEREDANIKRVRRFRADLLASDGIIVGSPEIHGSVSGVLKNALDLASSDEFEGKMVGLVGVAGGRMGATETLSHLRTIGRSLHAWVVPTQASIGDSAEAFDSHGEPIDPEVGSRLKSVGRQVAHFARLHKCENHMQFLKEWEVAPLGETASPGLGSFSRSAARG